MRVHGKRLLVTLPLDENTAIRLEQLAEEAEVNLTLMGRCLLSLAVGLQPVLKGGKGRNSQELKRANDFLAKRWPAIATNFTPYKELQNVKPSPYDITQNEKYQDIIKSDETSAT